MSIASNWSPPKNYCVLLEMIEPNSNHLLMDLIVYQLVRFIIALIYIYAAYISTYNT